MFINRPFYLISRLPMKRVAEMVGASNMAIKRFVKGRMGQQFFFDGKSKTIRSQQWKNYCIEIQNNGKADNLRATSGINSRWHQMFKYQGNMMVNEHGKTWDISNNVDAENRNIIIHNKHGRINQLWDLVYADEYPAEPTKG
jgi:ribosomal protein L21E